ncbi:MAG: DNA primase DnaG [Candidatus Nanoarchaeia archaeon]|nr:DNA primase DnaG [Candidatus Nanoarchaeia archaeon]MDD5740686.1 DNA primase DnaG [Candidatus Nanoarchaeia archaeon]
MAKISPVSIKYIIHAKFEAEGAVEKPDIIGAVFGQTEGLLGEDLEMRELQRSGKIGRIEVTTNSEDRKTVGEIEVPSAMDKTETTIIAAALETIERIGPSDTKIVVEDIEDVRGSKRDYILERAKKLMERLGESGNGISDMTDEIKIAARTSKIQSYGTENLPSGDISGDELIIVEGRADVVNLLKNGIKNAIAMNGTKLPDSVAELSKEKTTTLFVDGDRGGTLIIKNVTENADIDFIAMAPEGKEVEELAGKEILQALRKRVKASEYMHQSRKRGVREYEREASFRSEEPAAVKEVKKTEIKKMTAKEKEEIASELNKVIGSKNVVVFNEKLERIKKLPLRKIYSLDLREQPYIMAIDGTATPKIIEVCEHFGCSNLIATNFVSTDTNINLVSF